MRTVERRAGSVLSPGLFHSQAVTSQHRLLPPHTAALHILSKTVGWGNQLIVGRDKPPTISLDDGYKLVDQLEVRVALCPV